MKTIEAQRRSYRRPSSPYRVFYRSPSRHLSRIIGAHRGPIGTPIEAHRGPIEIHRAFIEAHRGATRLLSTAIEALSGPIAPLTPYRGSYRGTVEAHRGRSGFYRDPYRGPSRPYRDPSRIGAQQGLYRRPSRPYRGPYRDSPRRCLLFDIA